MSNELRKFDVLRSQARASQTEVFAAIADNSGRTFECYQNMLPGMSQQRLSRALTQLLKDGRVELAKNSNGESVFVQKAGAIKFKMKGPNETR